MGIDSPGQRSISPTPESSTSPISPRHGSLLRRLVRSAQSGLDRYPLLPDWKLAVLVAFSIGAALVGVLLAYTGGNLLYGGDYTGYYSAQQFLRLPSPTSAVFCGALFLTGNNLYAGFYLGLFFAASFAAFGAFWFASEFCRACLARPYWLVVPPLAALLYVFNPFTITDTFKSILVSIYPYTGFQFIFLGLSIRLWRIWRAGDSISWLDATLLGATLGLGAENYPNNVRIAILGLALLAAIAVTALRTPAARRSVARARSASIALLVIFVIVAALAALYSVWPYLSNTSGAIAQAQASLGSVTALHLPTGSFYNQVANVVRLENAWGFPNGFAPYYGSYEANPAIVFASWMWPVLALVVPLLLLRRTTNPSLVLTMEGIALLSIAWEAASNPPFGVVYAGLVGAVPVLVAIFPSGFLSLFVLTKFYSVLAAFSTIGIALTAPSILATVADRIRARRGRPLAPAPPTLPRRRADRGRGVQVVVAVAIGAILLLAAYPTFAGESEGQYFNESAKGFRIPPEYFSARDQAIGHSGSTLLLPATTTYIQTTWNYQGSVDWYEAFFYPNSVLTIDSFSPLLGYGQYSITAVALQQELSNPLVPNNSSVMVGSDTTLNVADSTVWGSTANVSGDTISAAPSDAPHLQFNVPFAVPVDASQSQLIQIQLRTPEAAALVSDFAQGTAQIGLESLRYNASVGATIGWYYPSLSSSAYLYDGPNSTVTVDLDVDRVSVAATSDIFNASSIDYLVLMLPSGAPGFISQLSFGSVSLLQNYSVSGTWLATMDHDGIHQILVDDSIIEGSIQSPSAIGEIERTLVGSGVGQLAWNGPNLQLIELGSAT
jgi:hypothetical protein